MFFVPSWPGENQGERLGEFESKSVKTRDAVESFHLFENSPKLCRGFHHAMKTRCSNMFYFYYKITIFRLNEKKDDIRNAYVHFHKTANSHNLETANHIPHVIFVLQSAMKTHTFRPIKMHVLSNFIKCYESTLVDQ